MPGTIQVIRPHAQTANKRPGSLGHSFAASSMGTHCREVASAPAIDHLNSYGRTFRQYDKGVNLEGNMRANLASDWRLVYAIIGSAIAGASTFLYYIAADVILADSGGPTRPIGLISGYCAFLAAIGGAVSGGILWKIRFESRVHFTVSALACLFVLAQCVLGISEFLRHGWDRLFFAVFPPLVAVVVLCTGLIVAAFLRWV